MGMMRQRVAFPHIAQTCDQDFHMLAPGAVADQWRCRFPAQGISNLPHGLKKT
jgi:hypothetical protein